MRIALLLAFLLSTTTAWAQDKFVNVYNWTDYIDPKALARFQQETGITVRYDVYDSLETLEGKLLAGHSGYDVVVPTSEPTFSRLVRAGALATLDRARMPHLAGLDPTLMKQLASSDPAATHGAIYLWGTIGLGLDPIKLHALAPDAPMNSWDLLFKPEWAKRFAPCGIALLDSAIDVIPTALAYLHRSPDSTKPEDLAAVATLLKSVRPDIRSFAGAGTVETLASGETCLALSYSGDVIQAGLRAQTVGRTGHVAYVVPQEAAQLWFDVLAIPADAPHKDDAEAFIDFMERPDVIAGVTNTVHYPNAVPASLPMVDKSIADDPNVYPPEAERQRFFTIGPVPATAARARSRMWAELKAGH
jgi:putrescine transport system substrate-binding protein